jgi:hypothetical protein
VRVEGETPIMLAMLATTWVRTGGAMASAYGPECPRTRRRSMRALLPAI